MPKKETAGTKGINDSERKDKGRVQKNDGMANDHKPTPAPENKSGTTSKKK